MQFCQSCGAKSWGPLSERDADEVVSWTDGRKHPRADFLKCDNCGIWGLKAVIDSAPQPIDFRGTPAFRSDWDVFKNMLPVPQSRLERLVKVIMRAVPCVGASGHESGEAYAAWAVAISRAIEKEMDREELLSKAPPSQAPVQGATPDAEFPQV